MDEITRELDKYDDYYVHQMKRSIIQVEDSDPQWFDRCYIAIHDPDGKFMMNLGMGVYPVVGLMDGWTSVVTDGKQRNIRVFRRVHNDRAVMKIGPLQFDIIEPMERWRLQMKENDFGITFDMDLQMRTKPYYYKPIIAPGESGCPDLDWEHYAQMIRVNGTLSVDGRKYDVKDCGWFRDRSWGSRRLWQWGAYWLCYAHFSTYTIYLFHAENIDNSLLFCDGAVLYNDGRIVPIVGARNKCEYEEGTFRHSRCEYEIDCEDGEKIQFTMKKIAQAPLIYGAGYLWKQGVDCGEYHIESDDCEVDAPEYRNMPTDNYDQLVEYDNGKERVRGWLEFDKFNINWKYKQSL